MKTIYTSLTFLLFTSAAFALASPSADKLSPQALLGEWKLDMTPHDKTDSNFAMMNITSIKNGVLEGEFYRSGVKIRNGHTNTQLEHVYGALVSSDNSGRYHTSFYLDDGVLYGNTLAIEREFLSVWTAQRVK